MSNKEFEVKLQRIEALLDKEGLEALLLRRNSSFAWLTGGVDAHINTADTQGVASLLVGKEIKALITNNIEAFRLEREIGLREQGWEFWVTPRHSPDGHIPDGNSRGFKLGTDLAFPGGGDLSGNLAEMRAELTPEEAERFRGLGSDCAEAMRVTISGIQPGMNEFEISACLSEAVESRGIQAIVNLVATDERIFQFRHPLPTSKKLDRYAMLMLCGRRSGLVCSLTRLVYFGRLPTELRRKIEAVAWVDATMIAASRPGTTMGTVLRRAQESYNARGYPEEWRNHHQGGLAGYEPREITALPDSPHPIRVGQAYAWNPSMAGVKSEDTILIADHGNEILTAMENWPILDIELDGATIRRPSILEVN